MSRISVSVIIPAYNSQEGIGATLNALLNQRGIARNNYEIIVVDNNSTDRTLQKAKEIKEKYPDVIRVFQQKIQGSYAARNMGISESKGEILCFIDSDMEPEDRYLAKVLKYFKDSEVDYGGTKLIPRRSSVNIIADYDFITGLHVDKSLKRGHYVGTGILCVRKRVIESIGNFDPRLESGGDVEFGKRVYDAGFTQKFLNLITIEHPTRDSFYSLYKKSKRVARGNAQLFTYYPKRFGYKRKEFYNPTYFLPNNPLSLKKLARDRGMEVSLFYCFFLSFIAVPLRFAGYISFKRELRYLQNISYVNK